MPKFICTITLDDGRHQVKEIKAENYDQAVDIIHEEHLVIEEPDKWLEYEE